MNEYFVFIKCDAEGCQNTLGCNQVGQFIKAKNENLAFHQVMEYYGLNNSVFQEYGSIESCFITEAKNMKSLL